MLSILNKKRFSWRDILGLNYSSAIIVVLMFSGVLLSAQTEIKGTVSDGDGIPLIGVNVIQKGTNTGTVTDINGNYTIKIQEGEDILVFSYIGFKTVEEPIENRNAINITMGEDVQGLEEVVVIGYAPVAREKVLGSISSVDAESIEQSSPVQAFDAVQGKLAGVQILSNNGPGEGFDIRVRGVSTFGSGTSPLYVVDGQQLDNIDNIDPSDIESLEVLKDGATAAIYGSKAANGVVLIKTKSGSSENLRLDISHNTGINTLVGDLPVVNSAERFLLEKKRSGDLESLTAIERDSLSLLRRNDYDLQDLLTRPALRSQTNVALSGGGEKAKFYWQTGYLNEEGVVRNSGFERLNSRLKLDVTPHSRLKVGTVVSLSGDKKSGLTAGGVFTHLVERLPYLPLYEPDGTLTPTIGGRKNPLAFTDLTVRDSRNFRIQNFNYAQVEILPSLFFKSTLGINWWFQKHNDFDTKLTGNRIETATPSGRVRQIMNYDMQQENFMNYRKTWGEHDLGTFAGMQTQRYFSEYTDFRSTLFNNEYIQTLNNAAPGSITGDNNNDQRHNLYSLFAGFNYDYANKYLVGGTIRRDGSSRFGDENEYGYFPSATLGWRVSNEDFLSGNQLINNLLIRASWGVVGNERIGNYLFTGAYEPGFGYDGLSGIAQTRLGNSELSWEETESYNFGFDLTLLKHRIEINFDLWQKVTTGLLATTPLPEESGFSGIIRNVGAVENRGVDFSITGTVLKMKDFSWRSNFNIGLLDNVVTKLDGGTEFYPGGRYLVREGEPIGNIYGYQNLGVYPYAESNAYTTNGAQLTPNFDENGNFLNYTLNGSVYTDEVRQMRVGGVTPEGGDIIWEDINGDFIIDADDRQIIGNGLATVYGGFSNDLRYKDLSLSFLFDFSLNHDIYSRWEEDRNDLAAAAESPGPERVYGAWLNPGDVTIYPRLTNRVSQNQLKPNSFFVTDGSFVKLRYIRLNYSIPKSLVEKIPGIRGINLSFAINNVLTWTNYKGYNPELGNRGSALTPNEDQLRYPNDRELIFGLKVQL